MAFVGLAELLKKPFTRIVFPKEQEKRVYLYCSCPRKEENLTNKKQPKKSNNNVSNQNDILQNKKKSSTSKKKKKNSLELFQSHEIDDPELSACLNNVTRTYRRPQTNSNVHQLATNNNVLKLGCNEKSNGLDILNDLIKSSPVTNPKSFVTSSNSTGTNLTSTVKNPKSVVKNPASAFSNPTTALRNPKVPNPTSFATNITSVSTNPTSAVTNPTWAIINPKPTVKNLNCIVNPISVEANMKPSTPGLMSGAIKPISVETNKTFTIAKVSPSTPIAPSSTLPVIINPTLTENRFNHNKEQVYKKTENKNKLENTKNEQYKNKTFNVSPKLKPFFLQEKNIQSVEKKPISKSLDSSDDDLCIEGEYNSAISSKLKRFLDSAEELLPEDCKENTEVLSTSCEAKFSQLPPHVSSNSSLNCSLNTFEQRQMKSLIKNSSYKASQTNNSAFSQDTKRFFLSETKSISSSTNSQLQTEDNKCFPPETEDEFNPLGTDDEILPPGTEDEIAPLGTDDEILPPGTEDEVAPLGTDDEIHPPGTEDEIASLGADDEILPPGTEDEIASLGADDEILPPGTEDEVILPPGTEDEVILPPGTENDYCLHPETRKYEIDEIFLPLGAENEYDLPPGTENEDCLPPGVEIDSYILSKAYSCFPLRVKKTLPVREIKSSIKSQCFEGFSNKLKSNAVSNLNKCSVKNTLPNHSSYADSPSNFLSMSGQVKDSPVLPPIDFSDPFHKSNFEKFLSEHNMEHLNPFISSVHPPLLNQPDDLLRRQPDDLLFKNVKDPMSFINTNNISPFKYSGSSINKKSQSFLDQQSSRSADTFSKTHQRLQTKNTRSNGFPSSLMSISVLEMTSTDKPGRKRMGDSFDGDYLLKDQSKPKKRKSEKQKAASRAFLDKRRVEIQREAEKKAHDASLPCPFFKKKGFCDYGSECRFSHKVEIDKRIELCKFYVVGACRKENNCLFMHEKWPCRFYHVMKSCSKGSTCKFSHEDMTPEVQKVFEEFESKPEELLSVNNAEPSYSSTSTDTTLTRLQSDNDKEKTSDLPKFEANQELPSELPKKNDGFVFPTFYYELT